MNISSTKTLLAMLTILSCSPVIAAQISSTDITNQTPKRNLRAKIKERENRNILEKLPSDVIRIIGNFLVYEWHTRNALPDQKKILADYYNSKGILMLEDSTIPRTCNLLNTRTNKIVHTLEHSEKIWRFGGFNHDDTRIIINTYSLALLGGNTPGENTYIWNTHTGTLIQKIKNQFKSSSPMFSYDGKQMIIEDTKPDWSFPLTLSKSITQEWELVHLGELILELKKQADERRHLIRSNHNTNSKHHTNNDVKLGSSST